MLPGGTETSANQKRTFRGYRNISKPKGCFQGVQKHQKSKGMLSGGTETSANQRDVFRGYRNISRSKGMLSGSTEMEQRL